MKEEKSDVRQ